jgi:hypothetical protein
LPSLIKIPPARLVGDEEPSRLDQQRIARITQKFLKENGTAAITEWTPSDFDRMQADLHNTVMHQYPELQSNLRFRITQASRVHADGPLEVHVEIYQVVGNTKLQVPRIGEN